MTLSEHNRQQVHLRKIGEYVKRLEALEAKLSKENGIWNESKMAPIFQFLFTNLYPCPRIQIRLKMLFSGAYVVVQAKFILEKVMKKILFIPAICILCVSCNDNSNKPNGNSNNSNKNSEECSVGNSNDSTNGNNQMQSQPADWDITAHVKKVLMSDNSLSAKARLISVTTNNGVVTLTGTVVNAEESRKVVRMVKSVPGVMSVDNQLTISSS